MRTEEEMMSLLLGFARSREDIRLVGMEGSRTNSHIPADSFQDYDITYFVEALEPFTKDDSWLSVFGDILMMQKPEDMELFPPEQEGYSYLVLFTDYSKVDFTLLTKDRLSAYLQEDRLRTILLDKDGILQGTAIVPTDEDYWLRKPSARSFDDCCNEFWNITPYVVKGICRQELLFAIDHLHAMRQELLRMLSWQVGSERGFDFSVGKNYKFLNHYISPEQWRALLSTYNEGSVENMWAALFLCHQLFREAAGRCAASFGYASSTSFLAYDENVSRYTADMYRAYGPCEERDKRDDI